MKSIALSILFIFSVQSAFAEVKGTPVGKDTAFDTKLRKVLSDLSGMKVSTPHQCLFKARTVWELMYRVKQENNSSNLPSEPILLNYASTRENVRSHVQLETTSQLMFAIYFINDLPGEDTEFKIDFETDPRSGLRFGEVPYLPVSKGKGRCSIAYILRPDSSATGISWVKANLKSLTTSKVLLTKKILSSTLNNNNL